MSLGQIFWIRTHILIFWAPSPQSTAPYINREVGTIMASIASTASHRVTPVLITALPFLKPSSRLFSTSSQLMSSDPLSKVQRFTLEPSAVKFPHGFLATGLHCGVKKDPSRLDLAVIISDRPCSAAGSFTRNAFVAAPVTVSKEVLAKGKGIARGIVINSGCANAVTGTQGLKDARAMSDKLDSFLSESTSSTGFGTLVMSTGVIGQLLPIKKILSGITSSTATLGSSYSAWMDTARAFMTTDTFPKLRTKTFELGGKEVRMVGIDKGAGMIHPNMGPPAKPKSLHATLLGMIATDAAVTPEALQSALNYAVDRSFNSISVDGDMSTNDTIVVLANGASGAKLISDEKSEEFIKFRDELTTFAEELAQLIVRDGEGATKFVKVTVVVRPCLFFLHYFAPGIDRTVLTGFTNIRRCSQNCLDRVHLFPRQNGSPWPRCKLGTNSLRRRLLSTIVRNRSYESLSVVYSSGWKSRIEIVDQRRT